jgi:signal transduction histidine kinase
MSAPSPRSDERNPRRVMAAGAAVVLAVAGPALVGWGGVPAILIRPTPADSAVSPMSAIGLAVCAAGLLAWAGERLRAAAWCGAAVSALGIAALVDAALRAALGVDAVTLQRAAPPFTLLAFVLAGLVSFYGAREAAGHPEGRRGVRVVAGGAALAVHAIGAAALLQRIFLGPSDPPLLLPPYAAIAFTALGAGMGAVVWRAETREPRLLSWRGAVLVGVALLWLTGVWSFALLRQESLRWNRERMHTLRTVRHLLEARIADRGWTLQRLGARTALGGLRFEDDAELVLRDLPSIVRLAWIDAKTGRVTNILRPGAADRRGTDIDAAEAIARASRLPDGGVLRPVGATNLATSLAIRTAAGFAGVVVAVSDTHALFDHQLGAGLDDETVAFVSYRGRPVYRSDRKDGPPPADTPAAALPFLGDAWELRLWWPNDPGPSPLLALLLAATGLALSFLGAVVVHLLGSARDHATELERRTSELESSNRDLNDFAHAASHDLKAPLRAIDSLAVWIAEDAAEFLPDESRKHLEQLRGRVQRLTRLLDDMLQYARAGQLRAAAEPVATGTLVSEVVDLLSPRSTIAISIAPGMPIVTSARAPLEQVFRNLLSNAIKHHDRLEGNVSVAHRDLGEQVEFAVSDDGPGIDPRHQERVFQMFQTLRPRDAVEGSGIGLALVRRLVQAYGGKVVVESKGRGTTFRFRWPKESAV